MATKENFVSTTLAATVSVAATTISVSAAISPFNTPIDPSGAVATLVLLDDPDTPTKLEIITYTGRTGAGPYTLTGVLKGREGTSDQSWASGDSVIQPPTAASSGGSPVEGDFTVNNGDVFVPDGGMSVGKAALESWHADYTVMQLGGNTALMATTAEGAGGVLSFCNNAYFDGAWKYVSTDEATLHQFFNGQHRLWVAASGTADTAITWIEAVTIDNDGNVGIGTSSPDMQLVVSKDGEASQAIQSFGTGTTDRSALTLRRARGTLASPAGVTSGNVLGTCFFKGTADSVPTWGTGAAIEATTTQTWTGSARGTKLTFSTVADGTVTVTARMLINHDGKVSIGKSTFEAWSSTWEVLQIGGNAAVMATSAEGVAGGFYFPQNAYQDGAWKYVTTDEASLYATTNGIHYFYVAASGTEDTTITWTEALRIDNDGGVTCTLKSYGETEVAKGSVSGAQTLNTINGNVFSATATGAITFTFTNSYDAVGFTLILTNGGTNITWPASVEWAGGTEPTLTTTGVDVLTFITNDGGTTWYGFLAGANFS